MKSITHVFFGFAILLLSCGQSEKKHSTVQLPFGKLLQVEDSRALLVLFPGFGGSAETIENELKIQEMAKQQAVSVLSFNFSQDLFLSEGQKHLLASQLNDVIISYELENTALYIGGFSSGGNVSFLLGEYLSDNLEFKQPQGVFCVDSPIDLLALRRNCASAIDRGFSDVAVEEAHFVINLFDKKLGSPDSTIVKYEEASVFTNETMNTSNMAHLLDKKIRFYTEPDSTWWLENRAAPYQETNAYILAQCAVALQEKGATHVELIQTKDRGYRANGDRHPHAWSIIDKEALFDWMLSDSSH